jgi:hypothetical protein
MADPNETCGPFTTLVDAQTWLDNSGTRDWQWFAGYDEGEHALFLYRYADGEHPDAVLSAWLLSKAEDPHDYSMDRDRVEEGEAILAANDPCLREKSREGISDELRTAIERYERRAAAIGYGTIVRATMPDGVEREGEFVELGYGGCQPGLKADGKRFAIPPREFERLAIEAEHPLGGELITDCFDDPMESLPKLMTALEKLSPAAHAALTAPNALYSRIPPDAMRDPSHDWWTEHADELLKPMVAAIFAACPPGYEVTWAPTRTGDALLLRRVNA